MLTNCKDPSQDAEFNEWYNHTHLPDVVNTGLLRDPIRFVKATDSPDDQQPRYLATYESDSDDPSRLMDEVNKMAARLDELGRVHPAIDVAFVGMLRRIKGGYWSRSCNHKVNGVMAVFTNCSDPSREEEFNHWYNDIHLSDILSTGGFHTDYRYEDINPPAGPGQVSGLIRVGNRPPEGGGDDGCPQGMVRAEQPAHGPVPSCEPHRIPPHLSSILTFPTGKMVKGSQL